MKKLFALILCCVFALTFTSCEDTKNTATTTAPTETQAQTTAVDLNAEIARKVKSIEFEGIVYLTHKGEVIYSQADGKNEKGGDLTIDTPMYIGSVSKQFCAAAIMMLSEQEKLSLEDTLDKYFPEYEIGKDITIKNLLSMRSGIPNNMEGVADYISSDKTESENIAIIKDWIFPQSLGFEPDTRLEYSNTNYFLLGNIVEQVSGQHYQSFIRANIFDPVGMTSSGFISEVETNPDFSKSLSYDTFTFNDNAEGFMKGMGDIVSTAHDMDKWMTALKSGKVVSMQSFEKMIADYSPDYGEKYGYGLRGMYRGIGHDGQIGAYGAIDYINIEQDYNLFVVGINLDERTLRLPELIMTIILDE